MNKLKILTLMVFLDTLAQHIETVHPDFVTVQGITTSQLQYISDLMPKNMLSESIRTIKKHYRNINNGEKHTDTVYSACIVDICGKIINLCQESGNDKLMFTIGAVSVIADKTQQLIPFSDDDMLEAQKMSDRYILKLLAN